MATLLFLGPKVDGDRDTYLVTEDMDAVAASHLLGAWEAGRSALRRERSLVP